MRTITMWALCAAIAGSAPTAKAADRPSSTDTADDARCRSYGAQPGSEGYARCRADLNKAHASDQRAAWADADAARARSDANAASLQAQMREDQARSAANLSALEAQVAAQQAAAQQLGQQQMENSIPH